METIALTIHVSKDTGAILEEKAKIQGKDVSEYVEDLIEKEMDRPRTLDEILAPVRKNFAESGMTEDELDDLIENERQAIWKENGPLKLVSLPRIIWPDFSRRSWRQHKKAWA